jgi:HipA-like protein
MRRAKVLFKGAKAGLLTQHDDGTYTFQYNREYVLDPSRLAISLTMPKTETVYQSKYLFPFFFHLLPEGNNRQMVSHNLRIDLNDDFGLLLNTARVDTIGAVTVEKIEEPV